MAKCFVCGKLRMAGQNVSHANNVTKRTFHANLQSVRALVEGKPVDSRQNENVKDHVAFPGQTLKGIGASGCTGSNC